MMETKLRSTESHLHAQIVEFPAIGREKKGSGLKDILIKQLKKTFKTLEYVKFEPENNSLKCLTIGML